MNQIAQIPDFNNYGYQIIKKLGQNQDSSLISWQAKLLATNSVVVIKQFCFATPDSAWFNYQTMQQEMKLLKGLNYLGIPQYLADFETENSFCFVRTYVPGKSLSDYDILEEKELKIIAAQALKILIYLQQQQPPVFHLNLNPKNILVDQKLNVYLINFHVTQAINSESNFNLINNDSTQFIAPEKFSSPSTASDLYSLGNSLLSYINNQRSQSLKVNKITELNSLDSGFQDWLTTMTAIDPHQRYVDAETAFKALQLNSWEEINALNNLTELNSLSPPALIVSIFTMGILGFALAIGWKITEQATEKSVINITIALMAIIVIYLSQSAATTIITNEQNEKKQAIFLAISVPLLLATVTGFIFGKGEAVAISLGTIIAQTLTLTYVVQQKLPLANQKNILKVLSLIIAIAIGWLWGFSL